MTEVTPMIGKKIVAAKMETDDGLRVLMLELDDGTVCEACAKTDVEVFVSSPLSQPTSPQPKRQGPFIPTVADLHALFAEEETKLEREAKCEHNWMYRNNTQVGCCWQCTKCNAVTEDSLVVAGKKAL